MGITSNPRVTAQLLAAQGVVGANPYRKLIVGQIGVGGSAVDGTFYLNAQDLSNAELETLFGDDELLNRVILSRQISGRRFAMDVLALSPGGGATAATVDLAFAGTATESKTLRVNPISAYQFGFTVDVVSGDTATEIATAVKAKIDALLRFPATAGIVTSTITLTATDLGTIPNKFAVETTSIPAGITVNTNSGSDKAQFSGGATDPTTTGIFDTAGTTRYHAIDWPWSSNFADVQAFLEARLTINNAFLQGVAFIGLDGTEAAIKAVVNGGTPLNSQVLCFMGNEQLSGVSQIVTPPDWRVSEFTTIEGLRLTDGAPIAQYVTVATPRDSRGSIALSSLPYFNTPLGRTALTDPAVLFDDTEQANLEGDGYSVIGVNRSKTEMITGPVVTTYKFNDIGDPDTSFKYLNYVRTGYGVLELMFNTLRSEYGQFRLTAGDLVAGRAITNADQLKGRFVALNKLLAGPDFVLTQGGADAERAFSQALTVEADLATGKVTFSGQLFIVTQFRSASLTFQLAFTVGG